jgi:hypothetical protein
LITSLYNVTGYNVTGKHKYQLPGTCGNATQTPETGFIAGFVFSTIAGKGSNARK